MSNSLFQDVLCRMKDAVDRVIGVMDGNGMVIACSDPARIGETHPDVWKGLDVRNGVTVSGGYTFCLMPAADAMPQDAVLVEGEDQMAASLSRLLAISLSDIRDLTAKYAALSGDGSADPKYAAAVRIAVESGQISTAALQRKIGIGYARSAKMIDRMEADGIVSGQNGTKPRKVLLSAEQYIARFACDNGENA